VSCGGSSGDTTVDCWNCDNVTPGKSDYDPSTECFSRWGGTVGRAATCSDAISQVQ
jgi:hypothetical protein